MDLIDEEYGRKLAGVRLMLTIVSLRHHMTSAFGFRYGGRTNFNNAEFMYLKIIDFLCNTYGFLEKMREKNQPLWLLENFDEKGIKKEISLDQIFY